MKKYQALSVGEIIDHAIARTGNSDTFERQQACFLWQEIVGPGINRYTTRRWIEGEVMHVCISSASIKNELTYCRDSLIAAINNAIGHHLISAIVIH